MKKQNIVTIILVAFVLVLSTVGCSEKIISDGERVRYSKESIEEDWSLEDGEGIDVDVLDLDGERVRYSKESIEEDWSLEDGEGIDVDVSDSDSDKEASSSCRSRSRSDRWSWSWTFSCYKTWP